MTPTAHAARTLRGAFFLLASFLVAAFAAQAKADPADFDIPAEAAPAALHLFMRQSGAQVLFSDDLLKDVVSHAVHGRMEAEAALDRLLEGTGFQAAEWSANSFVVSRRKAAPGSARDADGTVSSGPTAPPAVDAPERTSDETVVSMSAFTVQDQEEKGYLAKNTLSAFGTAANLSDAPQTLQIANRALLDDLRANIQYDAVSFTAGGVTFRSYNAGDAQYIWGFQTTLLLIDGIPFNTFGGPNNHLYDVDRVEVIKGPSSQLFGQNAYTGGMINVVTRQPTKDFHFEADATYGNFDYKKVEAHISGPITSDIRYRFDTGLTDEKGSDRMFSHYRDKFIGGATDIDLSDKTRLTLKASYFPLNYVYPISIIDPTTGHLLVAPASFTINEPWTSNTYGFTDLSGKLLTTIAPGLQSRSYVAFQNGTLNDFRPQWTSINVATHTLSGYYDNPYLPFHFTVYGQDFVKDLDLKGIDQKISVGFDQRAEKDARDEPKYGLPNFNYLAPQYNEFPNGPTAAFPAVFNQTHARFTGIYASDVINFWQNRISLIGGLRYNDYLQDFGAAIPAAGGIQTVQIQSKVTKRYALLVHPTPDTTVYYNHSEAFLFNTSNSGVDYLGNYLPVSTGSDDEVGGKASLLHGGLQLNATYFKLKLSNVVTSFTEGPNDPQPGLIASKVAGDQHNEGIDLGAVYSQKVGPDTINFVGTYYHGNIRDQNNNKAIGPANNTFSVLANYAFGDAPLKGFKIGAGERFQGLRDGYAFSDPSLPPVHWDAYTDVVAMASYQVGHYQVELNVDDVFNKIWIEGGETALWVYTNPGRTVRVTLSYKF